MPGPAFLTPAPLRPARSGRIEAPQWRPPTRRKGNIMTDTNSFTYAYERHNKLLAEANEKNKAALFQVLAGTTITRIHASFDGEGDSGQIDTITAYAGDTTIQMPSQELE